MEQRHKKAFKITEKKGNLFVLLFISILKMYVIDIKNMKENKLTMIYLQQFVHCFP